MNCLQCHHTDQAHKNSDNNTSLLKLGGCQIPDCSCSQYIDAIKEIDEELL
jgi:hypothetical protein